jgi:hypothetical protein
MDLDRPGSACDPLETVLAGGVLSIDEAVLSTTNLQLAI